MGNVHTHMVVFASSC